jgi:hypothetical protein
MDSLIYFFKIWVFFFNIYFVCGIQCFWWVGV